MYCKNRRDFYSEMVFFTIPLLTLFFSVLFTILPTKFNRFSDFWNQTDEPLAGIKLDRVF